MDLGGGHPSLLRHDFTQMAVGAGSHGQEGAGQMAQGWIHGRTSQELLEDYVKPVIQRFLGPRGLELSAEKTIVTHIRDGFDFLGQNVRKYGDKLLITPSHRSVNSLLEKVRSILRQNRHTRPENLIWMLNPIIRGWAYYHRHAVSKKVFADIFNTIWHALRRGARRRHPNKSSRWIANRYFQSATGHRSDFTATDHKGRVTRIFRASSIPIQRYVKIRADANPYDPAYDDYFEERLAAKWQQKEQGRRKLRWLWHAQDGKCPECGRKITRGTGWRLHYIIRKSDGGAQGRDNLVLLHPECHRVLRECTAR